MKKRTFTIIELIIVMTILAIMFLITRNYFSSENKIYYEGETCINNAYYMIKDIKDAALLGRNRQLSGTFIAGSGVYIQNPDWYNIVFRPTSYYIVPHFTFSVETTSGLVKSLAKNPLTGLSLGVFSGQSISSNNVIGWMFFYRGTGDVTKTINANLDTYNIQYFPMWGVNYWTTQASGSYYPLKGCTSPDYFVTYRIDSPYSGTETALRLGFQNSSSINTKQMILWHMQWLSGTIAEANTGSINFQVCNKQVQCKETHRLFFDTRVNDIFLQRCATYGANKKCTSWQGGNIN